MNIVGIIPAAGTASRLSPIPCSKEILPIGIEQWGDEPYKRPKVAIQYVLDSMKSANIQKTYIVIRNNKWDIPAYLGDGSMFGMNIAYVMMGVPYGAPFSINQAYPFIGSAIVALGYPDILFQPANVYSLLIEKLKKDNADVVLGLFPATNPRKMDMIEFDRNNNISRFVIKPEKTELQYTYINAVWTSNFTKFMRSYLKLKLDNKGINGVKEYFMGDIFQEFIHAGNNVDYIIIKDGCYFEIGTIDDYESAIINCLKEDKSLLS